MSQFGCIEAEDRKQQFVCVLIQDEPWGLEGVVEISDNVDFPCRRVPLRQEESLVAIFVDRYIHHHHGMAILVSLASRIDKDITWLHVSQPSGGHLPA